MSTLLEAIKGAFGASSDILFFSDVLRQYRAIRQVYAYEYEEEDKQALKACATDLRPFTYSLPPAAATFWGLGRMVRHPAALGVFVKAGLVLLRLSAAAEVLRAGYLVGSYRQGVDCMARLVALRSPLGGEIAALVRERDPDHPLLKHERPPAELLEDGSRPRIVSEANRLAQIAHLQRELAAAKAGGRLDDRVNRSADEYLFSIMRQRELDLDAIRAGGGATAAAAEGRLDAAVPPAPHSYREQYGEAAARGASVNSGETLASPSPRPSPSLSSGDGNVSRARGGGLVITDEAPQAQATSEQLQQRAAELAAAAVGAVARHGGGGGGGGAPAAGEDPLGMMLGGSWGAEEGGAAAQKRTAEEEERQRRREQRRKAWWRRKGSGGAGGDGTA